MTYNHYLLFDNSVQWFTAICRVKSDPKDMTEYEREVRGNGAQMFDVPNEVGRGSFIANLASREIAFSNRHYGDNTWVGYAISEAEFNRAKRLIELTNPLREFNRLINYP